MTTHPPPAQSPTTDSIESDTGDESIESDEGRPLLRQVRRGNLASLGEDYCAGTEVSKLCASLPLSRRKTPRIQFSYLIQHAIAERQGTAASVDPDFTDGCISASTKRGLKETAELSAPVVLGNLAKSLTNLYVVGFSESNWTTKARWSPRLTTSEQPTDAPIPVPTNSGHTIPRLCRPRQFLHPSLWKRNSHRLCLCSGNSLLPGVWSRPLEPPRTFPSTWYSLLHYFPVCTRRFALLACRDGVFGSGATTGFGTRGGPGLPWSDLGHDPQRDYRVFPTLFAVSRTSLGACFHLLGWVWGGVDGGE